jgi:hypothetical protein
MGFATSFANAYNAIEGVKSDIQSKNIFKEASMGEQPIGYTSQQAPSDAGPVVPDTPDVSPAGFESTVSTAQDTEDMAAGRAPKAEQKAPTGFQQQDSAAKLAQTYERAAEIATIKGNPALAQDFSKKAQDLARAESVKQLERLKVTEKTLDTLGQMVPAASTKEDIINIIGDNVKNPQTALLMGNAVKNAPTLEVAKKIVEQVSMTAKERLDAEYKVQQGLVNQYKAETERARELTSERREARLSASGGTDNIKLTGAEVARTQRGINATGNIASSLEALNKFSAGTTTGFLPELTTKKGMTNALTSATVRSLSKDEANEMNTVFTGIGRSLAAVETGGLATGLAELSKKMEDGIYIRPGDKPKAVAGKLADIRRITEESLQPAIDSGMLTPKQQVTAEKLLERIRTAVPYTTNDVIDATRKPGAKTIGETSKELVKPKFKGTGTKEDPIKLD